MNSLNQYILEKFKISKDIKSSNSDKITKGQFNKILRTHQYNDMLKRDQETWINYLKEHIDDYSFDKEIYDIIDKAKDVEKLYYKLQEEYEKRYGWNSWKELTSDTFHKVASGRGGLILLYK